MNTPIARTIAYAAVALLAMVAVVSHRPQLTHPRPAELLSVAPVVSSAPREPVWVERRDTLRRGESLAALFERHGLPGAQAMAALRGTPSFNERRIPSGLAIFMRGLDTDSVPSEFVLQFAVDRLVRLTRGETGWLSEEERLAWSTDTASISGVVSSTLYQALDSAGSALLPPRLRAELAWSIADIMEYRVDMSRDLKEGDAFRVLFERASTESGAVRLGRVLAVSMSLGGDEVQAFRFAANGGTAQYYDGEGKSLRAAFLRAPLEFRRISSVFGMRKHPIRGEWRAHRGTDYAAASGTPVRAIGDAVVVFAGTKSGYGNTVDLKHPNGYVTRYAHLRGFAKNVRRGSRVGIGETIGFVGMTGMATGPHLHFEVIVNGVQRDPRMALQNKVGMPLGPRELAAFRRERAQLLAGFDRDRGPVRVAVAD